MGWGRDVPSDAGEVAHSIEFQEAAGEERSSQWTGEMGSGRSWRVLYASLRRLGFVLRESEAPAEIRGGALTP